MIGFWERVAFAFRCLFSILFLARIPDDIARKLVQPAAPLSRASPTPSVSRLKELERPPAETFDRAVQILVLLQRDGRLVDFLAENISPYPDVQLGAAGPAMRCFNVHAVEKLHGDETANVRCTPSYFYRVIAVPALPASTRGCG